MAVAITFATDDDDRWGPGKGSPLTAPEADIDLWNLKEAVEYLQAHPVSPDEIASITSSGLGLTFHLLSGGTIGPVPVPRLLFKFRGDWAPATLYAAADLVRVYGSGIYFVMLDHTSDASFDPALLIGGDPVYQLLVPYPGAQTLGQAVSDVSYVARDPVDGDLLRFDGTDWIPVRQRVVIGVNANGLLSADQDLVHFALPCDVTWDADFAAYLSYAPGGGATAAADDDTVFTIDLAPSTDRNNFDTIGTITVLAGSVNLVFETTGNDPQVGLAGDVVRVRAPSSPDATLAGFYATIPGFETAA